MKIYYIICFSFLISMIFIQIPLVFSLDRCVPSTQAVSEAAPKLTAEQIYDNSIDALVTVTAYTDKGGFTGSGVVFDSCGDIVTNYHVIMDAPFDSVYVTMNNGKEYHAEVLYYNAKHDLALLKIPVSGTHYLKFPADYFMKVNTCTISGDPSARSVENRNNPQFWANYHFNNIGIIAAGFPVYALGNPDNQVGTITGGIISKACIALQSPNGDIHRAMVTDATIFGGSSGGALLDQYGRLVGITEGGSITGSGLNYAIPYPRVIWEMTQGLGMYYDKTKCAIAPPPSAESYEQACYPYVNSVLSYEDLKKSQQDSTLSAAEDIDQAKMESDQSGSTAETNPLCSAVKFIVPC